MSRMLLAAMTALGIAAAATAASAPAYAQDDHVALLKNVTGDVKILRDGVAIPAASGASLMRFDVISAGKRAAAGIVFMDGTLLSVGPSSEIELQRYVFRPEEAKYDFAVFLKQGEALYTSGKLAKLSPESVKVSTPRATVGVRGTRFLIENE